MQNIYPPMDYQRVLKVQFVRKRVFSHHEQVLHDYYVIFDDGTADCMSYTPIQGPPKVGEYVPRAVTRLYTIGFCRWGDTVKVSQLG